MTDLPVARYLYAECSQDDGTEDRVVDDPFEDVPLPMNLAGVELIKELHQDKGVEHNGVVLGGRGVQGRVPAIVYIKYLLTCERQGRGVKTYSIEYLENGVVL